MYNIRLKQDLLFYVYNFIIPLVIPSIIIILIGIFFESKWQNLLLIISTQIFLYNTVILSTNIGLLNQLKNKTEKKKTEGNKIKIIQKNIAISLCFLWLNLILLLINLMFTFSDKNGDIVIILLILISIIFIYVTLYLISRNELISFANPPNTIDLVFKGIKADENLRDSIINKGG